MMIKQQRQEIARPNHLQRCYKFSSHEAMRDFLQAAAELSADEGLYPKMDLTRNYVKITIHADERCCDQAAKQRRFARRLDGLRQS
jgi:pterin-4a-carbinolamine dehydratase